MNKELIDSAWSVLPKKFKEGVKYRYHNFNCYNHTANIEVKEILEYLFSPHNLTSDAEEEVMLMVEKRKVQDIYAQCEEIEMDNNPNLSADIIEAAGAKMGLLDDLFGSKCLPDEVAVAENATTTEPKPAEPKFKYNVGDEVKYKLDGEAHKIAFIDKGLTALPYQLKNGMWASESDLEPCTEPKENVNLSQNIANCDKCPKSVQKMHSNFGHSRLNIAAMAMQGILSNEKMLQYAINNFRLPDETLNRYYAVAQLALAHADALIAEAEKGDNDGN